MAIDFIQNRYEALDNNERVVALLFDLTRASDSLDSDFFTNKIIKFWVKEPLDNCLKSLLKGRKFQQIFLVQKLSIQCQEFILNCCYLTPFLITCLSYND